MINTISKDYDRTDHSSVLMPQTVAERYLKRIYGSTSFLSAIRTITMPSESFKVHGLFPSDEQLRGTGVNQHSLTQAGRDAEDQSNYLRTSDFYEITLNAKEYSLSKGVSKSFLQNASINSIEVTTDGTLSGTLGAAYTASDTTLTASPTSLGFPENSNSGFVSWDSGSGLLLFSYTGVSGNDFTGVVGGYVSKDGIGISDTAVSNSETVKWYHSPLKGVQNGLLHLIKNPNATQRHSRHRLYHQESH